MSTVTSSRPINLGQLAAELADPPAPLSMSDDGAERAVTCHADAIAPAALQAAVDAHAPAPPPPTAASLLQAQVDELSDLLFTIMEGM